MSAVGWDCFLWVYLTTLSLYLKHEPRLPLLEYRIRTSSMALLLILNHQHGI